MRNQNRMDEYFLCENLAEKSVSKDLFNDSEKFHSQW